MKVTLKYRITAEGLVPVDAFRPHEGDGNNNYKDIAAQTNSKKRRPCSSPDGRIEKRPKTLDSVAMGKRIENRSGKAIRSILEPKFGTGKAAKLTKNRCHTPAREACAQSSSSGISFERSSGHPNRCGDSKLYHEGETREPPESRRKRLCVDSDRHHVLNEDINKHTEILSPEKALHAAMLKRRFANIIFKATHQTLLDKGAKIDSVRMSRERERLKREKAEDNARIEAEVEGARLLQRQAERMKLEKMQKTVDINDNLEVTKEFDEIVSRGCQPRRC